MQQVFYFITLYNVQTDRIGSFVVLCLASDALAPLPKLVPRGRGPTQTALARSISRLASVRATTQWRRSLRSISWLGSQFDFFLSLFLLLHLDVGLLGHLRSRTQQHLVVAMVHRDARVVLALYYVFEELAHARAVPEERQRAFPVVIEFEEHAQNVAIF